MSAYRCLLGSGATQSPPIILGLQLMSSEVKLFHPITVSCLPLSLMPMAGGRHQVIHPAPCPTFCIWLAASLQYHIPCFLSPILSRRLARCVLWKLPLSCYVENWLKGGSVDEALCSFSRQGTIAPGITAWHTASGTVWTERNGRIWGILRRQAQ